ncbi:MAG: FtsX-like permease family protein [Eubacteriales bacterium]
MKIITKLALSRIRSKKARSTVICAAIFLTMVLFMTVVSISFNMLSGLGLSLRLAVGTDYHGYLRAASFTVDSDELRNILADSGEVKKTAYAFTASIYALDEESVVSSSDALWIIEDTDTLEHFYTKVTERHFPQNDSEVLLNPICFPEAEVGGTVTLYYSKNMGEYSESASAECVVSGFMESSADFPMHAVFACSDTLEDTYHFGASGRERIFFMFGNTLNMAGKYDSLVNNTLGSYKQPDKENFGSLNTAYLESGGGEGVRFSEILLIVFTVSVVFFCSFLLIYNIYSIALAQDMQSFGLLNVIGTTHRQISKIISYQSLILYAAVLPVGLIAGYFIGWKMLSPMLFTDLFSTKAAFEFHPMIPVAAAVLTLFTLLWSATRPLKNLRSLTPIAAVDYSPAADLPKRYVRKKNYIRKNITPDAKRMAKYSVSRNRKKTVITSLSMAMSVILFVLIATLCDYMVEYTVKHMQTADFVIRPQQYYSITGSNSEYHPVPENAADELNGSLDAGFGLTEQYVSAVENLSGTEKVWKIRTAMYITETPAHVTETLRKYKDRMPYWQNYHDEEINGKLYITVVGIPDELFGELVDSDIEKIGEDCSDGYIMYDAAVTQNMGIFGEDGESVSYFALNYFYDGDEISLNSGKYKIMLNTKITPMYYLAGYAHSSTRDVTFYIPESDFCREFGEGLTYALLVNAKDDCYDSLYAELEAMAGDITITEDEAAAARYAEVSNAQFTYIHEPTGRALAIISGKFDSYTEMLRRITAIQTVGYSLAAMIFLVGALNIVNTALSSVDQRKREFAMLEAVGMTDKQLMRMLLTESLYSGGMAVLITVCIGFPIIAVIINTAMDALVSLNWLSGVVMLAVCIAVSIASGIAVFRLTKSTSVVERIKVE